MATKHIISRIKEFSSEQRLVFWGAVLMAVSVVLPWYSDLDAFRTGDMFLGITGPLYMVGLLMLGIGVVSMVTTLHRNTRDKIERIFSAIGNFYIMAAGFSAFLLLLVNSVFFHPKFGVNIAIKESRFGMLVALAGVIALGYGGYLMRKRHRAYTHVDIESNYEPLIKMPEQRPESSSRSHAPLHQRDTMDARDLREKTIEDVTTEEERQNTLL